LDQAFLVSASPKKDLWQTSAWRTSKIGWLTTDVYHGPQHLPSAKLATGEHGKCSQKATEQDNNNSEKFDEIFGLYWDILVSLAAFWKSHVAGRTISLRHGIYWAVSAY